MPYRVDRIEPARTAMIVVDMENDFVAPGAPMETPAGQQMLPDPEAGSCLLPPARHPHHLHHPRAPARRLDMGLFDDLWRSIASRAGLVDGEPGIEIYPEIAPQGNDIVIKKHRYSAFYGTDLEIVLRGLGVDTVIITGVTTKNCSTPPPATPCSATTRWCSCPTRRERSITPMSVRAGCRPARCTGPPW